MKKQKTAFDVKALKNQLAQIKFMEMNKDAYDGSQGILSQIKNDEMSFMKPLTIKDFDEIVKKLRKETGPTDYPNGV